MTGVLLVDKPSGTSSAAVIRRLKGRLGRRTKVGHVGTLDPFASGLLPLCVGEATKVARYLAGASKCYEGTIVLGTETDTLDPTGVVTASAPVPSIAEANLAEIARRFTGRIEQRPPMYSALKHGGVPLYRLARRGEHVARALRPVDVHALVLEPAGPRRLRLQVECSKGTYVRVLALDIGRALGTHAHLGQLRRLAVGGLRVEGARPLADLEAGDGGEPLPLLTIGQALEGLPRRVIDAAEAKRLRLGQQEPLARLAAGAPGDVALLVEGTGTGPVRGVIEADADARWHLVRLINPDPSDARQPVQG
jgi:tRNA pseudouridine55 synthase